MTGEELQGKIRCCDTDTQCTNLSV